MHLLLTTHKWVPWVIYAQLITGFILSQLIRNIFLDCLRVLPHGIDVISLTPKFAIRYANFMFPTSDISAMSSFLSNIPWIPKRSFWAGLKPSCECRLDTLPLLWFPRLSTGIACAVSLVSRAFSLHKIPSFGISAQTQCDTCNSILYVLNCLCRCSLVTLILSSDLFFCFRLAGR